LSIGTTLPEVRNSASQYKDALSYMTYLEGLQKIQKLLPSGTSNMYVNMIIGDTGESYRSKNQHMLGDQEEHYENNRDGRENYATKMLSSYPSSSLAQNYRSRQDSQYLYGNGNSDNKLYLTEGIGHEESKHYRNSDNKLYLTEGIGHEESKHYKHQVNSLNDNNQPYRLAKKKNTDGILNSQTGHKISENKFLSWQFEALAKSLTEKPLSEKPQLNSPDDLKRLSSGISQQHNSTRIIQVQVHLLENITAYSA
jgi:hypothetical protein